MLERKYEIPKIWVDPKPRKEIKEKKVTSDYFTRYLRKKFKPQDAHKI